MQWQVGILKQCPVRDSLQYLAIIDDCHRDVIFSSINIRSKIKQKISQFRIFIRYNVWQYLGMFSTLEGYPE